MRCLRGMCLFRLVPIPSDLGYQKNFIFSCEPDFGEVTKSISQALSINSGDFRSKVKAWIESDEVKSFWEVRSVTKTLLDYIECKIS